MTRLLSLRAAPAVPAVLNQVLACHQQLAATLARMLKLAHARQWAQLPALDAQCVALFAQLQCTEPEQDAAPEHSGIAALAARIRADQDQLTELVRPQFVRLMRTMEQLQRIRAL